MILDFLVRGAESLVTWFSMCAHLPSLSPCRVDEDVKGEGHPVAGWERVYVSLEWKLS